MTATPALLRKAAGLIDINARLLRDSCMIGALKWQCGGCPGTSAGCSTRREYEEHIAVARELRAAARRKR